MNTIAPWIDVVLAVTLLEAGLLFALHRAGGRGVAPRDIALNLLSGLCLMLALRCLARGAAPAWIALWLLAAGIAHGADIVWRVKRAQRAQPIGMAA